MLDSLRDRILTYEEVSDYTLTRKVPIVITVNGRGFRKTTSLLEKPFCKDFSSVMGKTLIKLASEIDGAVFLYSFNDEINIICRNDKNLETEAWYDNNIQKIVSAIASMSSIFFYTSAQQHNLKLLGEPIFLAKTFILPNITEVINFLIAKQHQASHTAISMACFYELIKIHSTDKTLKILKDLSTEDKYSLLTNDCKIDIYTYPLIFWRGMACYRMPKIVQTAQGEELKYKLFINDELPFFNKDQNFLYDILKK